MALDTPWVRRTPNKRMTRTGLTVLLNIKIASLGVFGPLMLLIETPSGI
jgi:hypothetical protein